MKINWEKGRKVIACDDYVLAASSVNKGLNVSPASAKGHYVGEKSFR